MGYRKDRFFSHTNPYILNADARRCSYFELGLPVMGIERTRPGVRESRTIRAFLKIIPILAKNRGIFSSCYHKMHYLSSNKILCDSLALARNMESRVLI